MRTTRFGCPVSRTMLPLCLLLAGGCRLGFEGGAGQCPTILEPWTPGESGRGEFLADGCVFGCSPDRPLMTGAEARLQYRVQDDSISTANLVSGSPAVLGVRSVSNASGADPCSADGSATVTGQAEGDTELVLLDDDGAEIDRIAWSVRDAASLSIEGSGVADGLLRLPASGAVLLAAVVRDGSRNQLLPASPASWTVDDPEIAALGLGEQTSDSLQDSALVYVTSKAAGTTTLRSAVGGLETSLVVEVSAP